MLIIRCAGCRKKLWRYDKIGPGEVLRCHKARITKDYGTWQGEEIEGSRGGKIRCTCGMAVGIDKGSFYKMIAGAFTCAGTKRNS